jgi:Zn-dependent protease
MAITVHEASHAWMANRLGDPTARLQGRISLNPLHHIDILGTVIFPAILLITRSPVLFGWAKPVPVNPLNLSDPKRDHMKIALAGPGANFALAVALAIILRIITPSPLFLAKLDLIGLFCLFGICINLFLGLFNLIPVPPLDGSGVLMGILPREYEEPYARIYPYGGIILLIIIMTGLHRIIIVPIFNFLLSILL